MNDLKNLCILVTRPKPQGEILCQKIIAASGCPIFFPVIDFVPLDPPNVPDQYDWIIFMSPRAANEGLRVFPKFSTKAHLAAIGQGTAKVLEAAGFKNILYPLEEWSSEGITKLAEFQVVTDKRILLVSGEGGRETLAEILTDRGAKVLRLAVYRRILPIYDARDVPLNLLCEKKIDIVVCTSYESLHNLLNLVGKANQLRLMHVKLLVVSERLVGLASSLGFKNIFLAKNASDKNIIEALSFIKGNDHGK